MTYEELTQLVTSTAEELQTTLKLYYIGNIWHAPYSDDRSWAVCFEDLRDPVNRHHFAPHNYVLGRTDAWAGLTTDTLHTALVGRHGHLVAKNEG